MGKKTGYFSLLVVIALIAGAVAAAYYSDISFITIDRSTIVYAIGAIVTLLVIGMLIKLIFAKRGQKVGYKPLYKIPHDEPQQSKASEQE